MLKPITPDIAVAYSLCPRKAFLLLCTDEQGTPHDYPRILAEGQRRNQANHLNDLKQRHSSTDSITVTRSTPSTARHTLTPSTPPSLSRLRDPQKPES